MSDFVNLTFVSDPDTLTANAITYLQSVIPGWVPADGNLEVWLLAAHARINAELAALASNMPTAALRQFGTATVGLPPITGTAATITTIWTASDLLGHTIPAGTQVGYRVSGDTLLVFVTTADVVIPAGAATLSGVVLTAVGLGVAWNGVPTGPLELVDSLSWVSTVAATAVSAGGVDPETVDAYQARLVAEFRLFAPRPILPGDFSVMAQNVTGVYRALTVDGYDPGTNEKQQVAVTGSPTGGSTALTFSGQTATVPWNTTASGLQSLLVALSSVGSGNVACTGGPLPGTPIVVEFTGALGVTNVPSMTKADSYTGGSSPATVITTPVPGVAPSSGNTRTVCVYGLDAAGADVSSGIRTQVQTYLDGQREVGFVVNVGTATRTTINVTYQVHVLTGYDPTATLAACTAAVQAYLSPANWDGGTNLPPTWSGANKVRYLALSTILGNVPGVGYVAALTVNSGTSDVTMSGTAPLPAVGTVTGTTI